MLKIHFTTYASFDAWEPVQFFKVFTTVGNGKIRYKRTFRTEHNAMACFEWLQNFYNIVGIEYEVIQ